jgi:hypothetical protein
LRAATSLSRAILSRANTGKQRSKLEKPIN